MRPGNVSLGSIESGHRPGREIIQILLRWAPEFDDHILWVIVVERFADFVHGRCRAGAPEAEIRRYTEWIERLAQAKDPRYDNLVTVDFLEAAPWDYRNVSRLFGPATLALMRQTGRSTIDESMRVLGDHDHASAKAGGEPSGELVEAFDIVGDEFALELLDDAVLAPFADWTFARAVAGDEDAVKRAFAALEELVRAAPEELGATAVRDVFHGGMTWPVEIEPLLGPRTRELYTAS